MDKIKLNYDQSTKLIHRALVVLAERLQIVIEAQDFLSDVAAELKKTGDINPKDSAKVAETAIFVLDPEFKKFIERLVAFFNDPETAKLVMHLINATDRFKGLNR